MDMIDRVCVCVCMCVCMNHPKILNTMNVENPIGYRTGRLTHSNVAPFSNTIPTNAGQCWT